jgi:Cu+-exporting ATPase
LPEARLLAIVNAVLGNLIVRPQTAAVVIPKHAAASDPPLQECSLAIEGMTCTGCENTIQEAVTKVQGIASVKASHLDSTAVVSFDSTQTSISAIGDAVTEAGYVFKGEKTATAPAIAN